MQSVSDTMCLLLVFLLLIPVQMTNIMDNERPRVIRFFEVLTKSKCRPIEKLVNVKEEFSDYVKHTYIPTCVPLFRCSGCSTDEAVECGPTAERNVIIEVKRSNQDVNLTFVEHQACEFRKIEKYKSDTSKDKCTRDRPRREKHRSTRRNCKK